MKRRHFLALPLCFAPLKAFASEPEIFTGGEMGAALSGYDAVSYFGEGGPMQGAIDFKTEWKGAVWLFASAANLAAFKATPEAFAPQYGGYCAYAVSKGSTAPGDPEAWTVHGSKLYVNLSPGIRQVWKRDIPGNIARANGYWPAVLQ